MKFIYLIWLILPALYLFVTLKAYVVMRFEKGKKEDLPHYWKQLIVSSLVLALAVVVDQYLVERFVEHIEEFFGTSEVIRLTLYPLMFLIYALLTEKKKK